LIPDKAGKQQAISYAGGRYIKGINLIIQKLNILCSRLGLDM
jgi:hypothetical protein